MNLTALTRWDPLRDMLAIEDRMSRLFGDTFTRSSGTDGSVTWFPLVDISEEEDRVVLRAEIPGVSKDDIDIRVEGGTITLRGEKKQEKQVDSENAHRVERFYGSFARSFVLPASIKADAIKASYRDGVLEVVLPKSEEAKPRKIEVLGN